MPESPLSYVLPPWTGVALAQIGQHEIPGPCTNPFIAELDKFVGLNPDDETPWCSAFVGWCLEQALVDSTRKANARSYLEWGRGVLFAVGAVCVLWRDDPASSLGHVGFALHQTDDSVILLGGNQGDAVSVARFPRSRVLSYRWPA